MTEVAPWLIPVVNNMELILTTLNQSTVNAQHKDAACNIVLNESEGSENVGLEMPPSNFEFSAAQRLIL